MSDEQADVSIEYLYKKNFGASKTKAAESRCICPTVSAGPEYSLKYVDDCPKHGKTAEPPAGDAIAMLEECAIVLDLRTPATREEIEDVQTRVVATIAKAKRAAQPADGALERETVPTALSEALEIIQGDPHQWSTRPCETCRRIGAIYGHKFGCYLYAEQRALAAQTSEPPAKK